MVQKKFISISNILIILKNVLWLRKKKFKNYELSAVRTAAFNG